ncbi:hypothetical protein HDV05_003932 [Chytridiales sp. JEL 0842]|nr:hypothetical protein HDV05_003932 [Chytridiales sp. JEL 0842]
MKKDEREKCWSARDAYFACLKEHGLWLNGMNLTTHDEIVNMDPAKLPVKTADDRSLTREEKKKLFTCQKVFDMFTSSCPYSWAVHFSVTRAKELQKDYLIKYTEEKEKQIRGEGANDFWSKVANKPVQ